MTKRLETTKKIETNSKAEEKVNSSGNKRGTSPASIANLKAGGPGRPKGKLNYDTRVDMAIEALALKFVQSENAKNKNKKGYVPLTIDDVDIEGDIFMQHLNKARGGDRHFIDSYLDRRYGKATQKVELTGKDGNPIEYEMKLKEAQAELKRNQSKWFKKK